MDIMSSQRSEAEGFLNFWWNFELDLNHICGKSLKAFVSLVHHTESTQYMDGYKYVLHCIVM